MAFGICNFNTEIQGNPVNVDRVLKNMFSVGGIKKGCPLEFRFAAERTLGRLAKWLRILGFDTLYEPDLTAGYFIGLESNRIILIRRAPYRQSHTDNPFVVIRTDHYWDQLVEVVQAVGITAECIQPFSRCIRCNSTLMPANKADLQGKVPDYVWETHHEFRICQGGCQRIYWAGSHIERSIERIRDLFNVIY